MTKTLLKDHLKEFILNLKPKDPLPKDFLFLPALATQVKKILVERRPKADLARLPSPCFDLLYFQYHYPLCWFRSMVQCMLFSTEFRNLISSENLKVDENHKILTHILDYLKDHAAYLSQVETPEQQDWHALYRFPGKEKGKFEVYFDDMMCYLMFLLNEYNASVFPVNKIKSYFGRRYMIRFFRDVFSEFAPLQIISIKENKTLIHAYSRLQNQTSDPTFLVVDYGTFVDNIKNTQENKLALYVTYNNKAYSLQSVMVTSIFNVASMKEFYKSVFKAHQFCIYRCNDSYFSSEHLFSEKSPFLHVANTYLLEHILVNNGEILSDFGKLHHLRFNAHKCVKVGIYMPCNLHVTPEELVVLQELGEFIRGAENVDTLNYFITFKWSPRLMALLMYFFRFIRFTTNRPTPSPSPYLYIIHQSFADHYRYSYKIDGDAIKSVSFAITSPYRVIPEPAQEVPVDILTHNIDVMNYTINVIQHVLSSEGYTDMTFTFNPGNMIPQNAKLKDTLKKMFDIPFENKVKDEEAKKTSSSSSNKVSPVPTTTPAIGGTHGPMWVLYNKRRYKLRYEKNKKRYILIKKEKHYVKDLKNVKIVSS